MIITIPMHYVLYQASTTQSTLEQMSKQLDSRIKNDELYRRRNWWIIGILRLLDVRSNIPKIRCDAML